MATYETPELDKSRKIVIGGEDAKELFMDHATRNGKFVKEQLARRIWAKHDLPMYRGTIVDEVPFVLKIDAILFSYKEYSIAATYRFISE